MKTKNTDTFEKSLSFSLLRLNKALVEEVKPGFTELSDTHKQLVDEVVVFVAGIQGKPITNF